MEESKKKKEKKNVHIHMTGQFAVQHKLKEHYTSTILLMKKNNT